jgi:biopolymer transport protein ExbB
LEQTVRDAAEREAAKLYRNVRWLNLSAGVTPLMGLLGTVQGMIMAFYVTANLPTGVNKAQSLAQGIYVALVTTFGGLCVAIPAAMLSHFFEGRIQRLFGELDETLLGLMPQLERFEGKVRVNKEQLDHAEAPAGPPPAARREPAA